MELSGSEKAIQRLCSSCGLCCSGVLFVDVQLQDTGERKKLVDLDVTLEEHDDQCYLVQPCSCLKEGNHCRIYNNRPNMCASFDCQLIQGLMRGEIQEDQCFDRIEQATDHVEAVKSILRKLGSHDEEVPLFLRTEEILSQPWDLTADDSVNRLRDTLFDRSAQLSAFLENHFLEGCGEEMEED